MGYVFLTIALVLNAGANILLKFGSQQFAVLREVGIVRAVVENYFLLGGLALFALNVLFYTLALSRIPLSLAYPAMVIGGLLIVTTGSVLYLGESLTLLQAGGLSLIILGVILLYV